MPHKRNAQLLNLALDRIQSIEEHADDYRENKSIDFGSYYDDVIGVTKSPGQRDCQVVFWIDDANAPYVITKPLHHTQKVISEENGGKVFTIRVILNFELERELLGFGRYNQSQQVFEPGTEAPAGSDRHRAGRTRLGECGRTDKTGQRAWAAPYPGAVEPRGANQ
jgi:hypothetical protein